MKNPILVANWKATKTIKETVEFIQNIKSSLGDKSENVVICPPFTSLPAVVSLLEDTPIKIGAQDVSKFRKGAYTGEVTIEMLDGLVSHCIVGHSERRRYFGETDDDVIDKVNLLLETNITPILCVSDIVQLDTYLQRGKVIVEKAEDIIFVYEPPAAISGGGAYKPEDPSSADENARKIGVKMGKKVTTLYGGSINPENIKAFLTKENINGGLIGQASTNPDSFRQLIEKSK